MQSVQYCSSHLLHMDFSGSDLVQQKANTSPSSPTTSSSSLSSYVGTVHTCVGTCSHGPYGGYHTCLRIKNCCKCKSTHTYSCNSVPYDAPMLHACEQVLNTCPIETMNIILLLLSLGQSVGVRIPNSRGHTEAWGSVSPTQGATPKHRSPYPQLKGPHQSVGVCIWAQQV